MTLQTESVERGSAVTGTQIANINVDGRSPLDMAKLIPGVQFTVGATYAVGNAANGANNFTANGTRPSQNQVTINGIGDVDTGNNGGMNASVSNDSIAEFKVLTGTYQAEYGRSAGAQIQLVTKSGTSQFHGSGYLYHRNEGLNANTFLNNIRPQFGLTCNSQAFVSLQRSRLYHRRPRSDTEMEPRKASCFSSGARNGRSNWCRTPRIT